VIPAPLLDNVTEVDTPERVRFRYRVAGPARRGLAYLIDLLVRAALALIVGAIVTFAAGIRTGRLREASGGVVLVVLFALEWGYYLLFEVLWNGSSPGKRALSLRVVKEGGFPITVTASVLRNLLRAADFLPLGYVLGLMVMAGDRRFRRLGDHVAGTMVVLEQRVRVAAPVPLEPPATREELEEFPPRPRLTAAERDGIEALLRRKDLSPPRRAELAEMIAPALARRMGVPLRDPVRFVALLLLRASGGGPRERLP